MAKNSTTGYTGVCKTKNSFIAHIGYNKYRIKKQGFKDPIQAALFRDKLAYKIFGKHTFFNFPELVHEKKPMGFEIPSMSKILQNKSLGNKHIRFVGLMANVNIREKNKTPIYKSFNTLPEAIAFRDKVLSTMTKEIQLKGKNANNDVAIVDGNYFDEVSKYSWYKTPQGYAKAGINGKGILMHRFTYELSKTKTENLAFEHINHNKLDNRIENLKACITN